MDYSQFGVVCLFLLLTGWHKQSQKDYDKNHKMFSPSSHLRRNSYSWLFFHKHFKKAQLLFCCSLSDAHAHMPTYAHPHIHTHMRAHTIQIPRQAYRQTSGAEQKGKLRQRREEREKGWCLVFIIHTRVACSVTLFSCSSPLSLYPGW